MPGLRGDLVELSCLRFERTFRLFWEADIWPRSYRTPEFSQGDATTLASRANKELQNRSAVTVAITSVMNRTAEHIDKAMIYDALGKNLSARKRRTVARGDSADSAHGLTLDVSLIGEQKEASGKFELTCTMELSLKKNATQVCQKSVSLIKTGTK